MRAVTFGSARMFRPAFDERSATALLAAITECGVTTFHVSHEYESYPLFCHASGAPASSANGPFEVIAKIGVRTSTKRSSANGGFVT
jgi:hypothetical protein